MVATEALHSVDFGGDFLSFFHQDHNLVSFDKASLIHKNGFKVGLNSNLPETGVDRAHRYTCTFGRSRRQ